MNKTDFINNYSLYSSTSNFSDFVINIITSVILGAILAWHYKQYYRSLSQSNSMTKTLISLSIITCFIITVVKSSLALSLGLVGALSIVRFRTPIKEPYELTYIFIAIAIGLGLGANQLLITIVSTFIILIVLNFASRKKTDLMEGVFFINLNLKKKKGRDNLQILKNISIGLKKDFNLRRIDIDKENEQINFNLNITSTNDLTKLKKQLEVNFKDGDISIVDGQRLTPF